MSKKIDKYEQGEQLQLDLDEEYVVVQDNSLIMGNYNMTTLEQKIFLIMVSTIKKDDIDIAPTIFKVRDIAGLLKVTPELLYRDLPLACKTIMSKVIEIKNKNGNWKMFNIISYAEYRHKQGLILIKVNSDAKPYLLQLKDYFTSFRLENALNLDGKYAIRIYQLTKSNLYLGFLVLEVKDLKEKLKLTQKSYEKFSNINAKVIKPSIKEINEKTDVALEVELIRSGRDVVAIKFNIKESKNYYRKVIYSNSLTKSNIKNGGFNNFEPRKYSQRYEYLKEQCLLRQATDEEKEEFEAMRILEG